MCLLYTALISPAIAGDGYECLGLSDDEISTRSLQRIFRQINNFMCKNESTILVLAKQEDLNLIKTISQGIKPQHHFSTNAKQILHSMRVQDTTSIGQDYGDDPKLLRNHLREIQKILEEGSSDLDEKQSKILRGYTNLLLFLSKF